MFLKVYISVSSFIVLGFDFYHHQHATAWNLKEATKSILVCYSIKD